jgi:hypothetical protein
MERQQDVPDVLVGDSWRGDRHAGGRGWDVNMRGMQARAIDNRARARDMYQESGPARRQRRSRS